MVLAMGGPTVATFTSNIEWAIKVGGASNDYGFGIVSDGADGSMVTGTFKRAIAFGSTTLTGNGQLFVMHANRSGAITWAIQTDGVFPQIALGLSGSTLVTGHFSGTSMFGTESLASVAAWSLFVMRVSSTGAIEWLTQAGGTSNNWGSKDIVSDGMGGAFVVGSFEGTASFGAIQLISIGDRDTFIMHINSTGFIDWAIREGGTGEDQAYGIASDSAGLFVTGTFSDTVSFSSGTSFSASGGNIFVMHVSRAGVAEWTIQMGASQGAGQGIEVDGLGALVTGSFIGSATFGSIVLISSGASDAFVVRVSSAGTVEWAIQAGGTGHDDGTGLASDGIGGALVTGTFEGTITLGNTYSLISDDGSEDIFFMHVSSAGVVDWAMKSGGAGADISRSIASGSGHVLVTGSFESLASFGNSSLTSAGREDVFVVRLALPPVSSPPPGVPPLPVQSPMPQAPLHSPSAPPPSPPSGAIIEMTGDAPKIVFGSLESPVCDLTLNRAIGGLQSSCAISTPAAYGGRRLGDFDESPYQSFKSELRTLREEVVELRRIVRGLEMKNADQDEFQGT